jgi:maltose-binding protein MalE
MMRINIHTHSIHIYSIDRSADLLKRAGPGLARFRFEPRFGARFLGLVIVALLLTGVAAGCAPGVSDDESGGLDGRVLLWHAWQEPESEALLGIVERYRELNPDVQVQVRDFADEEAMLDAFATASASGLGPDLFLAASTHLRKLANSGQIADIHNEVSPDVLARYVPSALATLESNGALYGLPESQNTMVLFYNRNLVDAPPADLDEMLDQLEEGALVLMGTNFIDAFWGVQAFGGRLFDENGQIILDQGGFANWLAYLRDARDLPGMIMDSNRQVLLQRFAEGGVEYYVGKASELVQLQAALGEAAVGIAPLPQGPLGPAGPFMETRAFFFSRVSSSNQRDLALDLAAFVTNAEQNASLLREASHVPANQDVRINPRLNPLVNAIARQARTAIPLPTDQTMQTVLDLAGDVYVRVLEGITAPAEAAVETTRAVNLANGLAESTLSESLCRDVGSLRILNTWGSLRTERLDELVRAYRRVCPGVILNVDNATPDEAIALIQADPNGRGDYHLFTGSQELLALLVEDDQILALDGVVDANALQRFRPVALRAMQVDEKLFGIPAVMDISALYVNNTLAPEPARTLGEVRAEAENGVPVAFEAGFVAAFWGVGAMGGDIIMEDEYQLEEFSRGFVDWLAWLKELQETTPALITSDGAALTMAFTRGESAYLVGGLGLLNELDGVLDTNISTAILPAGPGGPARSLAPVDGFMFARTIPEEDLPMALAFVTHVTGEGADAWLSGPGAGLPASTGQDDLLSEDPLYRPFVEEARLAAHLPTSVDLPDLVAAGDAAYIAVLEEGVEPEAAVAAMLVEFQALGTGRPAQTAADDAENATPTSAPTEESDPEELKTDD